MKYNDFQLFISKERLRRYEIATNYNSRKTMTLYRYNLQLSQELFTIISLFEVILRNKIDLFLQSKGFTSNWLYDATQIGGMFNHRRYETSTKLILQAHQDIQNKNRKDGTGYSAGQLIAELHLGFWRFMFAKNQYRAIQQQGLAIGAHIELTDIFDTLPFTPSQKYANKREYVFEYLLHEVNILRNKIAHHEPICFNARTHHHIRKNTYYARSHYNRLILLITHMGVNSKDLLYGLDHCIQICNKIDHL